MYIKEVEIANIRSIRKMEIELPSTAGWHVIIGDNGAGKSTVIRAISLALIGRNEAMGLRSNWSEWLNYKAEYGSIKLTITPSPEDEDNFGASLPEGTVIANKLAFKKGASGNILLTEERASLDAKSSYQHNDGVGWFSAAYGPYRRFEGGSSQWQSVFKSNPKLGAHLSVFGEDVALTEALEWLIHLNYQVLEKKQAGSIIEDIKKLVNSPDFLPHQAVIHQISSEGVEFKDGNGVLVNVNQLSDGYRSILSMTFELIRQLVRAYGEERVFRKVRQGEMFIDVPGIVLIDEIDAHLHPTWQTRIGLWFTKYFPAIQFIVSTHSPLICRASENGSIWRLASPHSEFESGQVSGLDKQKLIYGNILDAYGTEVFGTDVTISAKSVDQKEELVKLSKKKSAGKLNPQDLKKLNQLRSLHSVDDSFEL